MMNMRKNPRLISGRAENIYIAPTARIPEIIHYSKEEEIKEIKQKKNRTFMGERYILAYIHSARLFPRRPTKREKQSSYNTLNEAIHIGMCASCPFFVFDKRYWQIVLISY